MRRLGNTRVFTGDLQNADSNFFMLDYTPCLVGSTINESLSFLFRLGELSVGHSYGKLICASAGEVVEPVTQTPYTKIVDCQP
jgi:hypothetical protein